MIIFEQTPNQSIIELQPIEMQFFTLLFYKLSEFNLGRITREEMYSYLYNPISITLIPIFYYIFEVYPKKQIKPDLVFMIPKEHFWIFDALKTTNLYQRYGEMIRFYKQNFNNYLPFLEVNYYLHRELRRYILLESGLLIKKEVFPKTPFEYLFNMKPNLVIVEKDLDSGPMFYPHHGWNLSSWENVNIPIPEAPNWIYPKFK